ncbi:MAG TPA: hypothetical protein DCY26_01305 [Hyphomonas sp.]|nr:hypothetical protein [Hyphomonas sp.]
MSCVPPPSKPWSGWSVALLVALITAVAPLNGGSVLAQSINLRVFIEDASSSTSAKFADDFFQSARVFTDKEIDFTKFEKVESSILAALRSGEVDGALVRASTLSQALSSSASSLPTSSSQRNQAGWSSSYGLAKLSPLTEITFETLQYPFLFQSSADISMFQRSPLGNSLWTDLEAAGLAGVGFLNEGFTKLVGRSAFSEFDVLKGKKIQVLGSIGTSDTLKQLSNEGFIFQPTGSSPVTNVDQIVRGNFDFAEVYLQQGHQSFSGSGLVLSGINFRPSVVVFVMNRSKWIELPYFVQRQLLAAVDYTNSLAQKRQDTEIFLAARRPAPSGFNAAVSSPAALDSFQRKALEGYSVRYSKALTRSGDQALTQVALFEMLGFSKPEPVQTAHADPFNRVKVLFATDRKDEGPKREFRHRFGSQRSSSGLSFGSVVVSGAANRQIGTQVTQGLSFVDLSLLSQSQFLDEIGQSDSASKLMIFVHGFYNTFEDAVARLALMVADTKFEGTAILYSWPSDGAISSYFADGTNAEWSEPKFFGFIESLLAVRRNVEVSILSHSMGARIVSRWADTTARTIAGEGISPIIKHLIFAAPDVDRDVFEMRVPSKKRLSETVTLYACSDDRALSISSHLHQGIRAGEGGSKILVRTEIDSVDVSSVTADIAKHSYLSSSRAVLTDISEVVNKSLPPRQRQTLSPRERGGMTYWQMR